MKRSRAKCDCPSCAGLFSLREWLEQPAGRAWTILGAVVGLAGLSIIFWHYWRQADRLLALFGR